MTEEKLNELRQSDAGLRSALKMDEAERPQMPADLNERLMQRMAQQQPKRRRMVWPWIAAACVAGVMMIVLTPPKDTPSVALNAENEKVEVEQPINNKVEAPQPEKPATEVKAAEQPAIKVIKAAKKVETKLLAQEVEAKAEVEEVVKAPSTPEETKPVTLTERDIPVTRPENLQYTPEELALLKKQATEAYLKWVELELEISKYNLEQASK